MPFKRHFIVAETLRDKGMFVFPELEWLFCSAATVIKV